MRHNGLCRLSIKCHDKQSQSFIWKQEALQLRRYFFKILLKNQQKEERKIDLAMLSSKSAEKV